MKITQKATLIGSGLWLYIPLKIKEEFKIKEGDMIEIDILKNINEEVEVFTYRCKKCQHVFDREEDEDLFCPACGGEDIIKFYTDERRQ